MQTPTPQTVDGREHLRVAALSFAGVLLLNLFATLCVQVKVYPSVQWSLHFASPERWARAVLASFIGAAVLSLIITAGHLVIVRIGIRRA